MNKGENATRSLGNKAEEEALEISSTGYGLESVSVSKETAEKTSSQKQNDSESS